MAGIAMGEATRTALAGAGIQVVGHRWVWRPGRKGGIFDPHLDRDLVPVFNPDGFVGDNAEKWGALPGDGMSVNDRYCMCQTRWILRGPGGRFLPESSSE